jgi:Ca-activated chloride channel homolog
MRRMSLALLAAAILVPVARAQTPLFRAGVDVVRVDVSVTDHGKPVEGLTVANFRLRDDGRPVTITSVTSDQQVPLRVVLALDTSGSVYGLKLQELINASRGLVDALRPTDRIAVLAFARSVTLVGGFGTSRAAMLRALTHVVGGGATSVNDALQVALELVHTDDAEPSARPLVVVCTDGHDTASWLRGPDVLDATRRADVVVQAIEPPGSAAYGTIPTTSAVVEATGGRTWSAQSGKDLKRLFTQTLTEMRNRYLLTFSPVAPLQPGWHVLKVKLRKAHGDILARPGYYVAKGGR